MLVSVSYRVAPVDARVCGREVRREFTFRAFPEQEWIDEKERVENRRERELV